MGRGSDEAWRRWGETEPYYGVLAADRFRLSAIAAHRDEFWDSGETQVEERLATAERHFGGFARGRALDFGCGVGRLTLPMARRFGEAVGLDIAPAMLAEAQRNADAAGLANVRWLLSDDGLGAADGRFDLVMSCIVLQHIPVRRGLGIVRHLLDRVAPAGVAALHVCIGRGDSPAQALRYAAQRHVPGVHRYLNRRAGRPADEPLMEMNAYPLDAILAQAQRLGFGPSLVQPVAHGRFLTAQLLMRRERMPAE